MIRHINWLYNDSRDKITISIGDVFKFRYDTICRDGSLLKENSLISVIRETSLTPYNEVGPSGHNWLCRAGNGTTIWSTLEHCIERKILVKA